MRKTFLSLICIIVIILFATGCNSDVIRENSNPEEIALKEAEKITAEQGYSILSSEGEDVLIGDSDVFEFIKDVSVEEGYLEDDFNSMSGDRKIIQYELKEKSKGNETIALGIVVDKGKAIGAYLDYYEYSPGIKPVSFKDFIKELIGMEPTTYEIINNLDGVTMSVKEDTVSSKGLTVVLENNSNAQCIYSEDFLLEKKINDTWYQVPISIDGNYGFEGIGYDLNSGDNREWNVDWDWLYGILDAGEYRIVKEILDFRNTGDYDKYYLAAEFSIL